MPLLIAFWACAAISLVALPSRAQDKAIDPLLEVGGGGVLDVLSTPAGEAGTGGTAFVGLASGIGVDPLYGSATVTIPIDVPPGRKGLTPDLAIRYASSGRNGPFGLGWTQSLGAVTRSTANGVPVNHATGEYADAAGFDVSLAGTHVYLDRCIDTACAYWAASVEETWIDAYFDRAGNRWVVRDRSGVTYTYGAVPEARTGNDVATARLTYGWYLTEVRDSDGNSIEVHYRQPIAAGPHTYAYPLQVDYGGNPTAGIAHIFHGSFEYDDTRPDVTPSYRGGFAEQVTARTASIWVSVDGTPSNPTRIYRFNYEQHADTGVSLLAAVRLEVAGEAPPPPTRFGYYSGGHGLEAPVNLSFSGTGAPPSASASVRTDAACLSCAPPVTSVRSAFADVDGDGRRDYVNGTDGPGLAMFRNVPSGNPSVPSFQSHGALTTQSSVLADDGHLVIDMTGDGLPDYVTANTPGCVTPGSAMTCAWQVAVNVGGTLGAASNWGGVPADLRGVIPKPLPRAGTQPAQLIDLNGDLRPDILDCNGWTTAMPTCGFYRNTGSGFAVRVSWSVPNTASAHTPAQQTYTKSPLAAFRNRAVFYLAVTKRLADVNGDSLPDLISSESFAGSGYWDVWFNTGLGFAPDAFAWPAPSPSFIEFNAGVVTLRQAGGGVTIEQWTWVTTATLRDMDGDGRPEYVTGAGSAELPVHSTDPDAINRTPGPWMVFANTGTAFGNAHDWSNTDGATLADNWFATGSVAGWANNNNDAFDINADGIADNVYRTRSGGAPFAAALGEGPRANLLQRVDNGLGASWVATYVAHADEASALPFPVWTVATVEVHSGLSGPGNDSITAHHFSGGIFDPLTRSFQGFQATSATRRSDGRVTRRSFTAIPSMPALDLPGQPLKLVRQQVYDAAGVLLEETTTDWAAVPHAIGRFQVHPVRRVETTFGTSGGSTRTRTRTFDAFDAFNSLRSETITGDDVGASIVITREYLAQSCSGFGCLALLCPGLPTKTVVTSSGRALSEQTLRYDTCTLTAIEARLAPPDQSASSGQVITLMTLEYDRSSPIPEQRKAAQAGLPTTIKDARQNATTLRYACSNWLYPCQITNALGQMTSATYDLRWGTPLTVTDVANNATTALAYDGFGRLKSITRPLDAAPSRQLTYVFGSAAGGVVTPGRAEDSVREPNATSGYRTVVRFSDALGRPLGSKQQQYVDGFATTVMTDAVGFDSVGRVRVAYAPFSASSANLTLYEAANPRSSGTTYVYDALDRAVRVTNPDRTFRTLDYSVAGRTSSSDENFNRGKYPGSKVTQVRDGLGRLLRTELRVKEPGKTELLIAEAANVLDGLGRITSTTTTDFRNARAMTTTFKYDSLSRRVELTDPDSGTWRYGYDAAGNLVYQNDPKPGQHIELCYDALNRVSRTIYPPGDAASDGVIYCAPASLAAPLSYVQYRYDSGCGLNSVGRLCGVDEYQRDPFTRATIQTALTYDARGRARSESQTVTLARFNHSRTSAQTYNYDEADRLVGASYPTSSNGASEVFSYQYDDCGQLALVSTPAQTYATGLTYDLFERLTLWQDGSGLLHRASFDQGGKRNFQLQQLTVTAPQEGGPKPKTYQRLDYSRYDDSGNLLKFKDKTKYPTSALRNSWVFQYDGPGRLALAKRAGSASLSFAYDEIGNLLAGNGLTFERAVATRPHWLTAVSGVGAVFHDSNGAITQVPASVETARRSLDYDADGRLEQVTAELSPVEEHTARYVYDFRGNRAARIVDEAAPAPVITYFFGRWFDVTDATVTRHFYLGDQLIAESAVTGGGPQFPVYFVHSDHLGSTVALSCYRQGLSCADRSIKRYFRYGVYGQVRAFAGSGAPLAAGDELTDFLYTGQRWEWRTQLYDFGARFYDPFLATFLTTDPIPSHANPYAYASWNPVNRVDPTGLWDTEFSWRPGGDNAFVANWQNIYDPWSGSYDSFHGYGPWVAGSEARTQPSYASSGFGGFSDTAISFPPLADNYISGRDPAYDLFVGGAVLAAALQPGDVVGPQLISSLGRKAALPIVGGAFSALKFGESATEVAGEALRSVAPRGLLYYYTDKATALLVQNSQLGLPGRTLYLTPNGRLSAIQAQIELALPYANTGEALFEVALQSLDPEKVSFVRRVTGNVLRRGGGGMEIVYNGTVGRTAFRRLR